MIVKCIECGHDVCTESKTCWFCGAKIDGAMYGPDCVGVDCCGVEMDVRGITSEDILRDWWKQNYMDAYEFTSLSMLRGKRDIFLRNLAKIRDAIPNAEFESFLTAFTTAVVDAATERMMNGYRPVFGSVSSRVDEIVTNILHI